MRKRRSKYKTVSLTFEGQTVTVKNVRTVDTDKVAGAIQMLFSGLYNVQQFKHSLVRLGK